MADEKKGRVITIKEEDIVDTEDIVDFLCGILDGMRKGEEIDFGGYRGRSPAQGREVERMPDTMKMKWPADIPKKREACCIELVMVAMNRLLNRPLGTPKTWAEMIELYDEESLSMSSSEGRTIVSFAEAVALTWNRESVSDGPTPGVLLHLAENGSRQTVLLYAVTAILLARIHFTLNRAQDEKTPFEQKVYDTLVEMRERLASLLREVPLKEEG